MKIKSGSLHERLATLSLLILSWITVDLIASSSWFSTPAHKKSRLAALPLKAPLLEISGITRHFSRPHQYWAHNDSLDQARLFLVSAQGKLISEHKIPSSHKTQVRNIDWEDLTAAHQDPYDGARVIYVADSGNNFHWRDDLKVYAFSEPEKDGDALRLLQTYPYRFPHQRRHPPQNYDWRRGRCLDSEALFWWRGELFLIGKCVFGGPTLLWRLPRERSRLDKHFSKTLQSSVQRVQSPNPETKRDTPQGQPLTLESISLLDIKPAPHPLSERVTGAAIGRDHDILAVLTYRSVWFFRLSGAPRSPQSQLLFRCDLTQASAQPVRQAEAIEWSIYTPEMSSFNLNLRSLLILTEGRGVHNLTVNISRRECPHESSLL